MCVCVCVCVRACACVCVHLLQGNEWESELDRTIASFRSTILSIATNRRLWANRLDPVHPGLLLLKNVVRQVGLDESE